MNADTASRVTVARSLVPVATKTTLTADPDPSYSPLNAGGLIILTAIVKLNSGPLNATGTVTFADPAGGSIEVPLHAWVAVYYGTIPAAGTYSVFARYNGGPGFYASKSDTITTTAGAPLGQ